MNLFNFAQDLKPFLLALLLPPVPFLALLLLGAVAMRRGRWPSRLVLSLGALGIWLSCTEGFAQFLAEKVIHAPPPLSVEVLQDLKNQTKEGQKVAVLVLGGGARNLAPEYHAPALKPITEERLRYGAWVAKTIQAPLGFSGGIGWGATHLHIAEATVAQESAQNTYGVPLRWSESRSRDTRENAELTLPMLQADGVQTVVLVTHDLHMRRAMRAFSNAAAGHLTFIAAPVGLRRETEFSWQDWCPSEEGLPRVRYAVYEWLGLLAGH